MPKMRSAKRVCVKKTHPISVLCQLCHFDTIFFCLSCPYASYYDNYQKQSWRETWAALDSHMSNFYMLKSWESVCVRTPRTTIKRDLKDDCVLRVLQCCVSFHDACNRQLPLLIIIAGSVLSFPFSPPAAVYSCPSFTYATWLMPHPFTFVLHPLRFSAPTPPPPHCPIPAAVLPVNIKLPIYFMPLVPWTCLWIYCNFLFYFIFYAFADTRMQLWYRWTWAAAWIRSNQ